MSNVCRWFWLTWPLRFLQSSVAAGPCRANRVVPRLLVELRIGRDLSIQLLNHLIDEPPFVGVEGDALSDRFVRPAASTAAVLTKLLSHRGPVAHHLDQVNVGHLIRVGMELRMVSI